MRVLVVNDGYGDAGGVTAYLRAIVPGLAGRGHAVAVFHHDRAGAVDPAFAGLPHFGAAELGADAALATAERWRPDVAFAHNMQFLDLEARLLDRFPMAKFFHMLTAVYRPATLP